jgi:hypothetical protein
MSVTVGQQVTVVDALGQHRAKRALSPLDADAFLACDEEEWEAAMREGREPEPDPFPWPAEAVQGEVD